MKTAQLKELVLQALETELGGVEVVENLCDKLNINTGEKSPGREIVKGLGEALVQSMEDALEVDEETAQLVACECVVLAETKDHLNWGLLGECAKKAKAEEAKALKEAHDEVEPEEDEHLYHTQGWCRELWIQSLGMKAVLPPPEEEKDVKSAIGAARAKQARLKKS